MNEILRDAAGRLRAVGTGSARADARLLCEYAQQNALPFEELLHRRLAHEPVAYITGHREFWSLDFEVGPGALIPRPETETLVEQALRELPGRNGHYQILDLGTGTACLLVSLLNEYPKATGVGVDRSEAALRWARRNVARHGVESRCAMVECGWEATQGSFDLIVSNPPYVPSNEIASLPPDVREYEPKEALDGGPDGLSAYRAIAPLLGRILEPHGLALLEIGLGQHHLVGRTLEDQGLAVSPPIPDLAGIPRCLMVRKVAGKR